jgi:hypothetical protein
LLGRCLRLLLWLSPLMLKKLLIFAINAKIITALFTVHNGFSFRDMSSTDWAASSIRISRAIWVNHSSKWMLSITLEHYLSVILDSISIWLMRLYLQFKILKSSLKINLSRWLFLDSYFDPFYIQLMASSATRSTVQLKFVIRLCISDQWCVLRVDFFLWLRLSPTNSKNVFLMNFCSIPYES